MPVVCATIGGSLFREVVFLFCVLLGRLLEPQHYHPRDGPVDVLSEPQERTMRDNIWKLANSAGVTLQVDLDRLYDRVRNIREICDDRRRSLVVEGAGDDHLVFPPKEIVLRNVLLIADKFLQQVRMQLQMQALIKAAQPQPRPGAEQPKTNRTDEGEDPAPVEPAADAPALVSFPPLPPVPTITQPSATMFVVAQAMLGEMSKRRWDGFIANRFDEITGAYNAARQHIANGRMDEELLWVVDSLDSHVAPMRDYYGYVLPRGMAAGVEDPDIPPQLVMNCLGAALDKFFEKIYQVTALLRARLSPGVGWTLPCAQKGLKVFLHSCYHLFMMGDPTGMRQKLPGVKTRIFHAGARFLLLAGDAGPATIPGGKELLKGPMGRYIGARATR